MLVGWGIADYVAWWLARLVEIAAHALCNAPSAVLRGLGHCVGVD